MTSDIDVTMNEAEEGAHASLQIFAGYDYDRVRREFGEHQAKVWDLVRQCHEAEQGDLPIMDVHRLDVQTEQGSYIALAASFVDEGWLKSDPLHRERLLADFPIDPTDISAVANEDTVIIERGRVVERSRPAPNVADILRAMRDERIGRPSTYAKHIEKLMAMVEYGYVAQDETKRLTLTSKGETALALLRQITYPEIGIRHCVELEDDLFAIESGTATAYEIARKHLALVMDVSSAVSHGTRRYEGATSFGKAGDEARPRIPSTVDPETILAANHRLRRIKRAILDAIDASNIGASSAERSGARAATAAAASIIWYLNSDEQILDELQFNLGYRWLCGIGPEDELWTLPVYRKLVDDAADLRLRLSEILRLALFPSSPA